MKTQIAAVAALLVCSAGAAFAGEVTGNGKLIVVNGKSACAFSGLEDDRTNGGPGVVQNFGRHPFDTVGNGGVSDDPANIPNYPGPAAPGIACNPSKQQPD
jgi:hypothetical protein